jgi:hypothetical protein
MADAASNFGASVAAAVEASLTRRALLLAGRAADAVKKAAATREAKTLIAEAAADVAAVRTVIAPELASGEAAVEAETAQALLAGLRAGFDAGAAEQDGLLPDGVTVRVGAVEGLERWPIVGHDALAIATYQAAGWRFAAESLLGVASASGNASGILPGLADLARTTGTRAGQAAAEAFAAGVGAARIAVGEALRAAIRSGL